MRTRRPPSGFHSPPTLTSNGCVCKKRGAMRSRCDKGFTMGRLTIPHSGSQSRLGREGTEQAQEWPGTAGLCAVRGGALLSCALGSRWSREAGSFQHADFPQMCELFKGVSPAAPAAPCFLQCPGCVRGPGFGRRSGNTPDTLRPPHPPAVARAARLLRLGPGVQP